MMIIAAGERQVHADIHGNRFVLFDGGVYAVPKGASTSRKDGGEWIECSAHADPESGKAYAVIGGNQMEYVWTEESPVKKKGGGQADGDSSDKEPKEEGIRALKALIRNEVHRMTKIKK